MIIEEENGKTLGIVDLINFSPRHLRAETGIVIMDAERRKGYATETLEQLCSYARQVLHLHQLYGVVATGNEAALALYEKAGFQLQNRLNDWLYDGEKYTDAVLMQRIL